MIFYTTNLQGHFGHCPATPFCTCDNQITGENSFNARKKKGETNIKKVNIPTFAHGCKLKIIALA